MARILWTVFLLLTAISQTLAFQASFGKKYTYEFKGQVATGVIQKNFVQVSGFTLQAKVQVQWQLDTQSVFFKLSDVKYGEFNEKTQDLFQLSRLRIQILAPEDNPDIKEYIEELEQSFWISAGPQGSVNIEHGSQWNKTANFKLSVAALFQISINSKVNVYTEIEEGITGRCPVVYQLHKEPPHLNLRSNILNVTKVVLYDNCETRPNKVKFSIQGHKCSFCDEEVAMPLKTFGKTDYQIRVDHNEDGSEAMSFEKIDASGAIIFAPFGSEGNNILSFTNQTLKLVDVTDDVEQKSSSLIVEPAVGFVFPPEENNTSFLEKAKEKLPDVIKVYHTFDTQSLTIAEFVVLFRKFNLQNFDSFFASHVNLDIARSSVREGEIRISLLQALSLTGTEDSVQFILHLISKKMISRSLSAELIRVMPMHLQKASAKLLDNLTEFAESEFINQDQDILQQAVWLAYGTILKKTCRPSSLPFFPPKKLDFKILNLCSFLVQNLIIKFHSVDSVNEKLLLLSAVQNTQLPEAFELSITVVKSQLPNILRRRSIVGLMQVNTLKNLRQVTRLVMQIAYNVSENYLLRIYAFETLIYVSPTPELFAQLVAHLNKEPHQQVSSYIYSTLVTMANATIPCFHPLTKNAKTALLYVKSRRDDLLRYSKNRLFTYYNSKYHFGRTFQIASIASNESFLPEEIYIGSTIKLFGYSYNMLELVFRPRNLEGFLEKHTNAYGNLRRSSINSQSGLLNKIHKLLTNKRSRNAELSQVVLKHFDQDVAPSALFGHKGSHCLYEKNAFEENAHSAKHDLLMRCIKFSVIDAQLIVPNDMGFLTTLQLHVPLVYKMGLKGNSQIKKIEQFSSDFHFKFGMNFMVHTSVSVENPIRRNYGYALKTHAGLKISLVVNDANLNLKENYNKIKLRYHPTKDPYTLMFYKSVPRTFTPNGEKIVKFSDGDLKQQIYDVGYDHFGVGLTFNFTHDNLLRESGIIRDFKSFFHKSSRFEDYHLWIDKLFAGVRGNLDNLLLNPTGKYFEFSTTFRKRSKNPTDVISIFLKQSKLPFVQENGKLFSKSNYTLEMTTEGENSTKWSINAMYSQSLISGDESRFNFKFKRSPIVNYDENQFEMCLESKFTTSNYSNIFVDPLSNPVKILQRYNVTLMGGTSCSERSRLQIKVQGIGSQEEIFKQNNWVYKRCQKDSKENGFERSFPCWLLTKQRGVLDKFEFQIEHKVNSTVFENVCQRAFVWLMHKLYDDLEMDFHNVSNSGQSFVQLNFKKSAPLVDVSILKSDGAFYFKDVFIPSIIPHFELITVANSAYDRFFENAFYIHQPKCIVSGNYIQTTDRIVYKYNLTPCYHVVLADCSSKRLVLLMRQHEDKKTLKLFLDDLQIDIDSNTVTVNGTRVLEDKDFYLPDDKQKKSKFPFIYKFTNQFIIDAYEFGVKVEFDGRSAVISVTNWLRGLQCGLCGNFDGEKTIEFMGPRGELYSNQTEFATSYVIDDDKCL